MRVAQIDAATDYRLLLIILVAGSSANILLGVYVVDYYYYTKSERERYEVDVALRLVTKNRCAR